MRKLIVGATLLVTIVDEGVLPMIEREGVS